MDFRKITAIPLLLLSLWGCSEDDIFKELAANGELIVVTRNSPTTYYFDGDQAAGFEYDLLQAYADARGYTLRVEVAFTLEELIRQLDRAEAAGAVLLGPLVGGLAVQVGAELCGVEGGHALGEQRRDQAGEDIARAGGG